MYLVLLVLGIFLYVGSLIMHALAYSAFNSIDIFDYRGISRSHPFLIIPYFILMVLSVREENNWLRYLLLISSFVVFYEGVFYLEYGTALLHAAPDLRQAREEMLSVAQIVRFAGGLMLFIGSIFLIRSRSARVK